MFKSRKGAYLDTFPVYADPGIDYELVPLDAMLRFWMKGSI